MTWNVVDNATNLWQDVLQRCSCFASLGPTQLVVQTATNTEGSSPLSSAVCTNKLQNMSARVVVKTPQQSSNANLRQDTLRLYSSLMRVAHRWPTVATRQNRSLRYGLSNQIQDQFRKNQHITDRNQIIQLQSKAQSELDALHVILSDRWNKKVCTLTSTSHHSCTLRLPFVCIACL